MFCVSFTLFCNMMIIRGRYLLVTFFLFIVLFSCEKTVTDENQTVCIESRTRSSVEHSLLEDSSLFDVSESVACDYLLSIDKSVKIKSISPYVSSGKNVFYLINLDDGWRIVSADLRTKALLAKGDSGSIPDSLGYNCNFAFWLEDIANQILSLKASRNQTMDVSWGAVGRKQRSLFQQSLFRSAPVNPDSVWVVFLEQSDTSVSLQTNVPHLLATKWGQGNPWNIKCPIKSNSKPYLTGCVPTAVSQLLYYFHSSCARPSGLYHSIGILSTQPYYLQQYNPFTGTLEQVYIGITTNVSRSDYCDSCSRWELMPLDSISAASNMSGASFVSDLMVDIGNRLAAVYSDGATRVFPMPNSLQMDLSSCNFSYGWTQYNSAFKTNIVFLNIENAKPVLVTAQDSLQNGHAWIIDGGYQKRTVIHNYYSYQKVPYDTMIEYYSHIPSFVEFFISLQDLQHFYPNAPLVLDYSDTYLERYFLMNWGLDGYMDDGHYSCSISDNWDVFSDSKSIYYNISPFESFMYDVL